MVGLVVAMVLFPASAAPAPIAVDDPIPGKIAMGSLVVEAIPFVRAGP